MASSATTPVYSVITDTPVVDAINALKADIGTLQLGVSGAPVAATAATLAVTAAAHGGRTVVLDRAGGIAATLPAASGSGVVFKFFVKTTFTSAATIKVANASDVMAGVALQAADGGSTLNAWETAATSDTITFDGATTGGILGDQVELEDVAATVWRVRIVGSATGTEATPFSATV